MPSRPANEPRRAGEGRKTFLLRIDPALFGDLEAWAQDELRSVNGQIEYLLRQAVKARRKGGPRGAAGEPGSP
jgi:hypothetical protein